jgi:hypothetical protein
MAKLVIAYIRKKLGVQLDTIVDKDFSQLDWLSQQEAIYNEKGEKVSKSYFYKDKEAIRITYHKIYEDYKGIKNIFIGFFKQVHWIDWAGNIASSKKMQPYYFHLEPVTLGDGKETVVNYSSPKMRSVMKKERYNADDFLQSKNPQLYTLIYTNYKEDYEMYLSTGDKSQLVGAIKSEVKEEINAVLNSTVFESEVTIKDLIISSLQ